MSEEERFCGCCGDDIDDHQIDHQEGLCNLCI